MKEILLTRGLVTIVSDEDYHLVSDYKWYAKPCRNTFYAVRNIRIYDGRGGQRQLKLHSVLLGEKDGFVCDHIDGNGLNNRRDNIRLVPYRENARNLHGVAKTSRYPGVSYVNGRKLPWVAHISKGSIWQKTLGYFSTEEQAYEYYLDACVLVDTIHSNAFPLWFKERMCTEVF